MLLTYRFQERELLQELEHRVEGLEQKLRFRQLEFEGRRVYNLAAAEAKSPDLESNASHENGQVGDIGDKTWTHWLSTVWDLLRGN